MGVKKINSKTRGVSGTGRKEMAIRAAMPSPFKPTKLIRPKRTRIPKKAVHVQRSSPIPLKSARKNLHHNLHNDVGITLENGVTIIGDELYDHIDILCTLFTRRNKRT
jgi:hypothetical protein